MNITRICIFAALRSNLNKAQKIADWLAPAYLLWTSDSPKDMISCVDLNLVGVVAPMINAKPHSAAPRLASSVGIFLTCLVLLSCSLQPNIPVTADEQLETFIRTEAAKIVAVTADAENWHRYAIFLSAFPREDILGISIGRRRIYISYELARLAAYRSRHLWLLRQTLAHEIAHEISGHATRHALTFNNPTAGRGITSRDLGLPWSVRFRNYSTDTELQADLEGIRYWKMLNWDCRIWVRILENFQRQNYSGGLYHPTDKRLEQASKVCPTEFPVAPLPASVTTFVQ